MNRLLSGVATAALVIAAPLAAESSGSLLKLTAASEFVNNVLDKGGQAGAKLSEQASKADHAEKKSKQEDADAQEKGYVRPVQQVEDYARGKLLGKDALLAKDLEADYDTLSPKDEEIAQGAYDSGPRIPSACAEDAMTSDDGGSCGQCFGDAYEELNRLRYNLEKLRAIGKNNESYVKKQISFGDSASGIHGITGLAWQKIKNDIEKSESEFHKIYDNKYKELMGKMQGTMDKIAQCEFKYMDNPDWYDRYGFIYFTFVQDRYRR